MTSVIHDSVGAYVTDALEPPERSYFESHLEGCDHCRREVAEFDATLTEYARLAADLRLAAPYLAAGAVAGATGEEGTASAAAAA